MDRSRTSNSKLKSEDTKDKDVRSIIKVTAVAVLLTGAIILNDVITENGLVRKCDSAAEVNNKTEIKNVISDMLRTGHTIDCLECAERSGDHLIVEETEEKVRKATE